MRGGLRGIIVRFTNNIFNSFDHIGILGSLKEASVTSYVINLRKVYIKLSDKNQIKNMKPFKLILFCNPNAVRHSMGAALVTGLKDITI